MKSYDVAIIGAGPAGAVAAALCARSGLKTIIVEKKKLPRVKSCAGGITARAIRLLRDLNYINDQWFEKCVNRLMIHYPKTGESYELISKQPYLATVCRSDFDRKLAELAARSGAYLAESEAFVHYERETSGQLMVKTDKSEFCARILIGADGYYSQVRKQMISETGSAISFPMMFGIECDVAIDQIRSLPLEHCHLFFNSGAHVNYGWAFPKKEVINIGIVLDAEDNMKSLKSLMPVQQIKWFLQKISGKNPDWIRIGAAPIPLFGKVLNPPIQNRNVFLVGDAAGFADAWTGEGIYFGVSSAIFAHQTIKSCLSREKGLDYLSTYSKLCRKFIYPELRMSYWVAKMFQNMPSFYNYLMYPKVRELFVPHTEGKISYPKALLKAFLLVTGYKLRILT